jgi:hypothetical protein
VPDMVIRNFQKSRGLSQQVKHMALYAMSEENAILFAVCPDLFDSFSLMFRLRFHFFFVFSVFSLFLSFYFSLFSAPLLFTTP